MSNENTLLEVTNDLLLSYDNKFNENYNRIVRTDSTIQNKEQLIIKETEVLMNKEKNIIILQYSTFLVLIICILFLLYGFGKITFSVFIEISILMVIVFSLIIYYQVVNYFNLYNIKKRIDGIQVAMKNYAQQLLEDTVPQYQCPSQCDTKPDDDDVEVEGEYDYTGEPGDTLRTDPQLDVWKYGRIPYNQNPKSMAKLERMIEEENMIPTYEPKSSFGTTYPKSTYYECKWLGGGTRNKFGLPTGSPTNDKKYSTIPCSYKPNMSEVSRYICDEDPNSKTGLDLGKNCINITK